METETDKILRFKRDIEKLKMAPIKDEGYISPLNEAITRVKGNVPVPEAKTIIKGVTDKIDTMTPIARIKNVTDHIDTKSIQKIGNADLVAEKIRKIIESRAASKLAKQASGIGKSFVKGIPMLGGLAVGIGTALSAGDASAGELAATPFLSEADDVGPSPDSIEHKMESGTATPDELDQLRKRFQ